MYDSLYENQSTLNPALIGTLAQALQLDMERFKGELASRRFRERVKRDFMNGYAAP